MGTRRELAAHTKSIKKSSSLDAPGGVGRQLLSVLKMRVFVCAFLTSLGSNERAWKAHNRHVLPWTSATEIGYGTLALKGQ